MRLTFAHEPDDVRQTEFVSQLAERYSALVDNSSPDLVVVVGGDGAMLRAMRRMTPPPDAPWRTKRFLGIGRGTVNFLMNPEDAAERLADLDFDRLSCHRIHPLWVTDGQGTPIGAAYNDVVLGAGVMDWHAFRLASDDGSFDGYEMRSGGVCVATPVGSTAFNANNGGAVLPLDLPVLSVTGVVGSRDLNEIFAGSRLDIGFSSRTGVALHLDGVRATEPERDGAVTLHRDPGRWMELAFVDEGEFARRRIELLKAKRK